MRVAITGAAGLFGKGLVKVFGEKHDVTPLTRAEADLTRAELVRAALTAARPDVVVHPAGIADIDACEADPAKAFLVNYHGTRNVVEAARELGAGLIYISTDAVFDGKKQTPYRESDPAIPPTVYGRTKLAGERVARTLQKHWIFRVSVLFGPGKTNFVEKTLRKIASGEDCRVATDQMASATYTVDSARKILEVIVSGRYGLYHLSNSGACSRLEVAQRAAQLAGLDVGKVIGVPLAEMGRRAVRLKYAVMEMGGIAAAGLRSPRPWQEALDEYVKGIAAEFA